MLSLSELQRAVRIIQEKVSGARLRRIMQPDALRLVLMLETSTEKYHMLLACGADAARISFTDRSETVDFTGSFYQYLRAHLTGSALTAMECSSKNRQVKIALQSHSGPFILLFSILGARSNVYLLNADGRLVHSMRSLEETRREMKIGEIWADPEDSAPSAGMDRWQAFSDEEYVGAVERTYQQLELRNRADSMARRIRQALKREKSFLDRKLVNLREDLGSAKQAETIRYKGELLKNVLHTIQPGDAKAIATDFETGRNVEIALDPQISPAANLELYFTRYQKQLRGAHLIQQQLEEMGFVRSELEEIEQRLTDALAGELPDMQALEGIEKLPSVRRLIHRYFPKKKQDSYPDRSVFKKDVPARLLPKRYKTQEGLEIWVGRNDEGNDYLTTRLARGNDMFFHLEGYPGSHVVLRTEGRTDPPAKSILDACELAIHYSKLKSVDRADVHMAPIKNVKKPKGAKPGLVYVRSGKTIHLKRDPKRLQNILASRMD